MAELGVQISIAFWDALLERYIGTAREELGASWLRCRSSRLGYARIRT
jgi:hypothetical protein